MIEEEYINILHKNYYMIGINIQKLNNKKQGVTLVEVLISITLFAVIMISASQIFKMNIESQRSAIASQSVQENLKYFLEVMSKEVRTAQKDAGVCANVGDTEVYTTNAGTDELYFKNVDGVCVKYSLELNDGIYRFKVERGAVSGYITAHDVSITNLKFVVDDSITTTQSLVTIKFDAEVTKQGEHKSPMKLQTTISSRYYE